MNRKNGNIARLSILIPLITCITSVLIFSAYPPSEGNTGKGQIIAHGGGMIDRHKCTNSIEAVEKTLASGITHIELDIARTSDGDLISLHDWPNFNKSCGLSGITSKKMTEVKSSRMFGYMVPVTVEYIDSLMNACKNLRLVLDKETEFSFIDRHFGKYKDRIIVECFDVKDYVKYRSSGYLLPMMSGKPTIRFCVTVFLKTLFAGHPMFCGCYAVDIGELNSGRTMNPFKRIYSPDLAVYTLPDLAAADSLMKSDKRVKFAYVDNIDAK